MPAFLTEGGFMDSTVDIAKLRDDYYLKEQGEAIAEGLAVYFKLQPKASPESNPPPPPKEGMNNLDEPSSSRILSSMAAVLKRLEKKEEGALSPIWREKLVNGTLTDSEAIGLLYVALDRELLDEGK